MKVNAEYRALRNATKVSPDVYRAEIQCAVVVGVCLFIGAVIIVTALFIKLARP